MKTASPGSTLHFLLTIALGCIGTTVLPAQGIYALWSPNLFSGGGVVPQMGTMTILV